jgi:hypothetical protein
MDRALDCVCVIHGDRYPWIYVERLWSMLCRHLTTQPRLHVFTESSRSVPEHFMRHDLLEWPEISNTRRAWWYKMQMFDPRHALGRVLYLDLDVVITASLDWILVLDPSKFWAIQDWRRLWRPKWDGINSSMMYWDHARHANIWDKFCELELPAVIRQYHGDQDLLSEAIPVASRAYFDHDLVRSWRWEIKDGGMDTRTRRYLRPGTGSTVPPGTAVMVFHGNPKPHDTHDPVIQALWA